MTEKQALPMITVFPGSAIPLAGTLSRIGNWYLGLGDLPRAREVFLAVLHLRPGHEEARWRLRILKRAEWRKRSPLIPYRVSNIERSRRFKLRDGISKVTEIKSRPRRPSGVVYYYNKAAGMLKTCSFPDFNYYSSKCRYKRLPDAPALNKKNSPPPAASAPGSGAPAAKVPGKPSSPGAPGPNAPKSAPGNATPAPSQASIASNPGSKPGPASQPKPPVSADQNPSAKKADPSAPGAPPDSQTRELDKAKLSQLIEFYTKSVAKDPKNPWTYFNRGVVYFKKGDYSEAVADFTQAAGLNPKGSVIFINRGMAFSWKGDYDRALADFTKAIELNPEDYKAYAKRGEIYYTLGDHERAFSDYNRAVALNPALGKPYAAMNYGASNQAVVKLVESNKSAQINEGSKSSGSSNKPAPDAGKTVSKSGSDPNNSHQGLAPRGLDPLDYMLPSNLDKSGVTSGRSNDAADPVKGNGGARNSDDPARDKNQKDAAAPVGKNPASASNPAGRTYSRPDDPKKPEDEYFRQGVTAYNQGKYKEAIALFDKSLDADPGYFSALYHRGLSYSRLGDDAAAVEDFSRVIQLRSWYAPAYYNRAISYSNLSIFNRALDDYNNAIQHALNDMALGNYYNDRGAFFYNRAEYGKAIEDYNRAIAMNPFYYIYNNRGLAFYALGDYLRAVEDHEKALKLLPRYPDAFYGRGLSYHALGQYQRAIEDFNQALKLKPDYSWAYNQRAKALADLALLNSNADSNPGSGMGGGDLIPADFNELLVPSSMLELESEKHGNNDNPPGNVPGK